MFDRCHCRNELPVESAATLETLASSEAVAELKRPDSCLPVGKLE